MDYEHVNSGVCGIFGFGCDSNEVEINYGMIYNK